MERKKLRTGGPFFGLTGPVLIPVGSPAKHHRLGLLTPGTSTIVQILAFSFKRNSVLAEQLTGPGVVDDPAFFISLVRRNFTEPITGAFGALDQYYRDIAFHDRFSAPI